MCDNSNSQGVISFKCVTVSDLSSWQHCCCCLRLCTSLCQDYPTVLCAVINGCATICQRFAGMQVDNDYRRGGETQRHRGWGDIEDGGWWLYQGEVKQRESKVRLGREQEIYVSYLFNKWYCVDVLSEAGEALCTSITLQLTPAESSLLSACGDTLSSWCTTHRGRAIEREIKWRSEERKCCFYTQFEMLCS